MAPQYGEVRVDYITYTTGVVPNEGNATAYVSGLINNPTFSGNVVIEGNATIDGNLNVSGAINASGVVISGITGLFDAGTEPLPSIAFALDPNTGIYNPDTDQVGISTNGVERLRVNDTGDVGIGTNSANGRLHLKNATGDCDLIVQASNSSNAGKALISKIDADDSLRLTASRGTGNRDIAFNTALDDQRMIIKSSGDIGIGTSDPGQTLHVKSTAGTVQRVESTTTISQIQFKTSEGSNLYVGSDGLNNFVVKNKAGSGGTTEKFRVTGDGNVGIGVTTPQVKLDVSGDITSNGAVTGSTGSFDNFTFDASTITSTGPITIAAGGTGRIVFRTKGSSNEYRFFRSNESFYGDLRFSNLTSNRFYQMPDAGGTIALTEDITGNYLSLASGAIDQVVQSTGDTSFTGFVGIGSDNPSAKLTVQGTQNADPTAAKDPISDIYIQNVGGTQGQNNYGGSIGFSRVNKTRRGAMIAEVQTSSNADQGGLAFFTKSSTTASSDLVAERVRINHDGKVGIGETDPQATLDIKSDAFDTGLEIEISTGIARFKQSSSSLATTLEFLRSGVGTTTNNAIEVNASNGAFASIDYSGGAYFAGNVGIGTGNPQAKLHISKLNNKEIARFERTRTGSETGAIAHAFFKNPIGTTTVSAGCNTNDFTVELDGSEKFRIKADGDVGIGTTAPTRRLDVKDDINRIALFRSTTATVNIELQDDTTTDTLALGRVGDDLRLYTGENVRALIDSSGNFGINTTAPQAKLHVKANNTVKIWLESSSTGRSTFDPDDASIDLTAKGMNATTKYTPSINFGSTDPAFTTTNPKFGAAINANAVQTYGSDTNGGMDLNFWTAPVNPGTGHGLLQRMVIKYSGNVGIGTTGPTNLLTVTDDDATGIRSQSVSAQSTNTNKALHVSNGNTTDTFNVSYRGQGYFAANVGIGTSDPNNKLAIRQSAVSNAPSRSAALYLENDGNCEVQFVGNASNDCQLRFGTSNDSFKGALEYDLNNDRLRFYTDGTEKANISAAGGFIILNLAGTGNRAVYSNGSGSLTNASSDATLKTNVVTLTEQIKIVKQLNPVAYNWIDTESLGEQREIGFIAQEIKPLIPEVIGVNNDETLSVDYPKITAVLTKALQEAILRIEALEQRLTDI